jgi:CMP-N,N'-diacetyllegionaminic acid synthase
MATVAVIPARGGSKRLPRKNVMPVLGKPLVAWVIEAARGSTGVDHVYVSTEDPEIASVAATHGAKVIARPPELAADDVWTEPVIQHAVVSAEATEQVAFSTVVWLNASIPQITARDIDHAIGRLHEEGLREVFAVDRHHRCTSAVRVLRRDALFQQRLSVVCGVVPLDYVDVHTLADLDLVREAMENAR